MSKIVIYIYLNMSASMYLSLFIFILMVQLRAMFAPMGSLVDVRLIRDRNHVSRGFCFIEYATAEVGVQENEGKKDVKRARLTLQSDIILVLCDVVDLLIGRECVKV